MKITKIKNGWNTLQEINDALSEKGVSLVIGSLKENETITEVFIKEINGKTKGIVVAHNDVLNDDVAYIYEIKNNEIYLDMYGEKTIKLDEEEEDKMELEINYNKENETVEVGDVISTTTSSFDYNNVTGDFEKTKDTVRVLVKHVDSDYSEYDENKSRTGGKYGYDFYEIIEIIDDEIDKNELNNKIEAIVRDALHLLNNRCVTNYDEGEITEYVNYYIEQYREISDNYIENLLNQVDVILCTEEDGFDADNNEERLEKLYDNWRQVEQLLKGDIIYREILKKHNVEEIGKIRHNAVLKIATGKKLSKEEEYIHLYSKYNDEDSFTDEELEAVKENTIKKYYDDVTPEKIEELKKEIADFSFEEMDYYLGYKSGHKIIFDFKIKE